MSTADDSRPSDADIKRRLEQVELSILNAEQWRTFASAELESSSAVLRENQEIIRKSAEVGERAYQDFKEQNASEWSSSNKKMNALLFTLLLFVSFQVFLSAWRTIEQRTRLAAVASQFDNTTSELSVLDTRLKALERATAVNEVAMPLQTAVGAINDRVEKLEQAIDLKSTDVIAAATLRSDVEAQRKISEANYAVLKDTDERTTTLFIGLFGALLITLIASMVLRQ